MITDILLSYLTLLFAYGLRFNFNIDAHFLTNFYTTATLLIALKIGAMYYFRCYFVVWRFFGFEDAKNIIKAHLLAYTLFAVVYLIFPEIFNPLPRSAIAIDLFLSLFIIGLLRASKRFILEHDSSHNVNALIYGANAKTASIIKSALDGEVPYYPVAIIATHSESSNIGSFINNIPIYSHIDLEKTLQKHQVEAVIVAAKMDQKKLQELVDISALAGINDIKRVKLLSTKDEKLEDLQIEDLLARSPKDLDIKTISNFINNKRVLITGAGGSIGSEIARQCKKFNASAIMLIDHSEYNLYTIGEELKSASLVMANVTQKRVLDRSFKEFSPDIVIHAAAYKHVPLCEANIDIAVHNNVLGTKNVIDCSIDNGVKKLVIISTDKAVRPTSVMGATKRVTELYASNVDSKDTEIVAVRFGNVLGSSGSVIPKFKRQIESGGPLTVTDERMVRYFMMIPEACQLVLQAASIAKGGELFILDMGEPIKIVDLAKQMIRLYGKEEEIEIVFTGLRDGEKLYEELLLDESEKETIYSSIFIAPKTIYEIKELEVDIDNLLKASDKIKALKRVVKEFNHN